jgi:hypothetical protein
MEKSEILSSTVRIFYTDGHNYSLTLDAAIRAFDLFVEIYEWVYWWAALTRQEKFSFPIPLASDQACAGMEATVFRNQRCMTTWVFWKLLTSWLYLYRAQPSALKLRRTHAETVHVLEADLRSQPRTYALNG